MTRTLLASVLATVLAVVGSALGVHFGKALRTRLELLVHLATGVLLGITAFDILPEAKAVLSWPAFLASGFGGYLLLWVMGRFVFYVCPSCAIAHIDESTALAKRSSIVLLAAALGTHCLLDGIAIAAGNGLSSRAETGALLAVALHKLPEGIALGLLLMSAKCRRSTAFLVALAIESITILGAVVGATVSKTPGQTLIGVVFAIVGGGFIYLVYNAFGGIFDHKIRLPRALGIGAEVLSFLVTGLLFWMSGR